MDLVTKLRSTIRACLGLPVDPGAPPDLLRLGLYPSTVQVCAADGSTCDVRPLDARLPGLKNVPVRVSPPGSVAVVQQGAIVLLGWEGGDPARPYCAPVWYSGATVTKLKFTGNEIDLGGNTHPLSLWDTFETDLVNVLTDLLVGTIGGPTKQVLANQANISAMISKLNSGAYNSTIVKNG